MGIFGKINRSVVKCVYAGPEMMDRRKNITEMNDVYAGPDTPDDTDISQGGTFPDNYAHEETAEKDPEPSKFCPECGAKATGSKFCVECGYKLN